MRCLSWVILIAMFIGHPTSAAEFSYQDLVNLIQKDNLSSIEALLPMLPKDLRENYTLLYGSRSLQGASYKNPRAILFGSDGRLTCAFNGDPTQKGFDTLECFQFVDLERRFDFRQIKFPTPRNGLQKVLFSQSNLSADGTTSCSECHTADPRPNWDHYHIWPGAYGSHDDLLCPLREDVAFCKNELIHYPDFVKGRASHPRYKYLIQEDYPTSPYAAHDEDGDPYHRPNFRFSDLVGNLNSLRDLRLLESKIPDWQKYAFALGVLGCQLSLDQLQSISHAGLNFKTDSDLYWMVRDIAPNEWTTAVRNDDAGEYPNDSLAQYEYLTGFNEILTNVAFNILEEEVRNGNQTLGTLIASMQRFDRDSLDFDKGYAPKGAFARYFQTLETSVPLVANNLDTYSAAGAICTELSKVFMLHYLVHGQH